jgi:hypothetical protein
MDLTGWSSRKLEDEIMRQKPETGVFDLTKFVLFIFFIFLIQSCVATSPPVRRVESAEFKERLPGIWEGSWNWSGRSGKRRIQIIKIDGNRVDLTGYTARGDYWADTDEVYGRIVNSALILTWPQAGPNGVSDRYTMLTDDASNLILDGIWRTPNSSGTSQLKKID